MLDGFDLHLDPWPDDDQEWIKLIERGSIPPATVRRGVAFDPADPRLERLPLPSAEPRDQPSRDEPHPPVVTVRNLTCPDCDRPVVVVWQPWGTEPRRAIEQEIRGALETLAWHTRHPR